MNNLKVTSILDEGYDEYFGFTEEQVKKMCEDFRQWNIVFINQYNCFFAVILLQTS